MPTVRSRIAKVSTSVETPPAKRPLNISMQPGPSTPTFYANLFEVSRAPHDLAISGVRVPTKPNESELASLAESGRWQLEPDFQIVIAPTLVPKLIKALQNQLEKWHTDFGANAEEQK